MSAPKSSAVVMPTKGGEAMPAEAAALTKMAGGGLVLSPLPLSGGRKRRGTKRLSKKVLKMFKKGSAKKLVKMLKGGQEAEEAVAAPEASEATEGARRRKGGKTKRGSRKSRHSFLY
jgi:hypothetical protein